MGEKGIRKTSSTKKGYGEAVREKERERRPTVTEGDGQRQTKNTTERSMSERLAEIRQEISSD